MKKYKALIVDDEKNIREALDKLISAFCPEIEVIGLASSAQNAREILSEENADIIFLDISMPNEDGFDFLNSCDCSAYAIIFVTAYQEYALRALKANAIDFLLKPVIKEELEMAVNKAISELQKRLKDKAAQQVYSESLINLNENIKSGDESINRITIPEQFGFRIIKVVDIMYLEADSNYTILHFSGLNKLVATRSLCEFEKILDSSEFFRIHKSTIINLKYLKGFSSYQGNFAELEDGTRIIISRRKLTEFKEIVNRIAKIV